MKKILTVSVIMLAMGLAGVLLYLIDKNGTQLDGEISLSILDAPVTVHRDEHGIPYVFATNQADLIRTQGFLIAQDRLFQVELYRALIEGRLASLIGDSGLNSDVKMRVVNLVGNAKRHASFLDKDEREYLKWYVDGYNAYISTRKSEYPIELSLLKIKPKPLKVSDLVAIQHYIGFVHSKNYDDEILDLKLNTALGQSLAQQLQPLNINPDREKAVISATERSLQVSIRPERNVIEGVFRIPTSIPEMGSNNWVTAPEKSVGTRPILSNDPHLDARILPGPWYPIGLFTPDIKAVGASIPGLPGILTGRNQFVSFGVTNAYGDSQDLYIEDVDQLDPARYIDGEKTVAFQVRTELILIKDEEADGGFRENVIKIRTTERGPVISDHPAFKVDSPTPISLRWAVSEVTSPTLGVSAFLEAKSIEDLDLAIQEIDVLYFNFVFSDVDGGIAYRSSGLIPIRSSGAIAKPTTIDTDWQGFIPKREMPGQKNPAKKWLGTSNHDVIPDNYPYFYSTHFSPYYRYQRAKEFISSREKLSANDHWALILDVKNKHGERLTPLFISALDLEPDTNELAEILSAWDFEDDLDSVGATVFHLMHEHLIRQMFTEKLPQDLLETLLNNRYYWLQRTDQILDSLESALFDIPSTERIETRNDLIVLAARRTHAELTEMFGSNTNKWKWGKFHTVTFVSPLKQDGFASDWLGGGTHEVPGSGETLNRGQYKLNGGPYESQWFSSMRMVADMNDNEKIMAVVSGGNSARQFHPHFKSQLNSWIKQEWLPWWLSEDKVIEHSHHKVSLVP